MSLLRGDPGLLVAMADDREIFLDWLQSTGLNAVDALVVYYDTDSYHLSATIVEKETGENGISHIKVDEDNEPVTRQENYVLTAPHQRILGRWLGYLAMKQSEAQTLIRG